MPKMAKLLQPCIPKLKGAEIWECQIAPNDVKTLFPSLNRFWTQAIESWCKVNFGKPNGNTEICSQRIWYNSNLRIHGLPIFDSDLNQKGLIQIDQLYDQDGKMLSWEQFANCFATKISFCTMVLRRRCQECGFQL